MAGYSIAGEIGRGVWLPLLATAVYLEDADGRPLLLISCDLWAVPLGLADAIAERVHESHPHVGRSAVIVAATHTHHAPGQMATCEFWNGHASSQSGFDSRVFAWLVDRMALAAVEAIDSRQSARLSLGQTDQRVFARNRSLMPFEQNPEASADMEDVSSRLGADVSREETAVSPRVRSLSVRRVEDGALMGLLVFAAVHPTAAGLKTSVYSSDVFGWAAARLSRELGGVPVAFFNGAEGDVAAGPDERLPRDRRLVARVGDALAAGALKAQQKAVAIPSPSIRVRSVRVNPQVEPRMGGVEVARMPMVGAPALGGANDGATWLRELGFRPGVKGPVTGDHGAKRSVLTLLGTVSLEGLLKLFQPSRTWPKDAQITVAQVGDLLIMTYPGEFTTTLGRRLVRRVREAAAPHVRHVLPIGLANGFLYYVATEEEYAEQFYEGAATLYGPRSGAWFAAHIDALIDGLDDESPMIPTAEDATYDVGPKRHFSPSMALQGSDSTRRASRHLKIDLDTGEPLSQAPTWVFWGPPQEWEPQSDSRWPRFEVEMRTASGDWHPADFSFGTGDLLITVVDVRPDRWAYEVVVLNAPLHLHQPWRLATWNNTGNRVVSPAF